MHIKRKTFEHIYWPKLKVIIQLCFHSNKISIASILYIVFLIANQGEQHIFLSNHKISTFFKKKRNCRLCEIIKYSDSWNFMFIQLFVQDFFHFSKKKKKLNILTILKCHTIFDHVQDANNNENNRSKRNTKNQQQT